MDAGDHGFWQSRDREHQLAALGEEILVIRSPLFIRSPEDLVRSHLLEVMTGAEGRSRSSQDHDLDRHVVSGVIQFTLEFLHQERRQGIAGLGAIERQRPDAFAIRAQNQRFGRLVFGWTGGWKCGWTWGFDPA